MILPARLDPRRLNRDFVADVVAWERIPARPGRHAPLPEELDPLSRTPARAIISAP